ncbi:MAG: FkbM family methyltransferase [Gammaproteobacteria bacterium]|nr:FkbM family methyltransferase [Gammaproteobacteria bacterium]
MNLIAFVAGKLTRELYGWSKAPRQHKAQRAFAELRLGPGDIAIDCGANVGDVTLAMASGGATVHAFEPFPEAFAVLARRTRDLPNVHCHQRAVADRSGSTRLFLHRHRSDDPLKHASGSSLLATKHNLDPSRFIDVEMVALTDVIHDLGTVNLLKIDVEGFEIRLLNHLLDTGAINAIDQVFCETHEFKVAGLYRDLKRLRQRLKAAGIDHVNLDWH